MRVGLVTHYMPPHHGGIERVVETLYAAYAREGMDVRWVASRVPPGAPARENGRIRVGCWNAVERLLGVPVPVWGPDGWREVARLVRWAEVLHVHDCLYLGTALAVLLARRRGTPVLLSQHVGFVQYRVPLLNVVERAAYATLGRIVLRRASRLVFATPGAEHFVTALLGGDTPRARVVPNGIDTGRFRPATPEERRAARARFGLEPSAPLVLFAGRLVEKKGIPVLVDVARRLPSVRFLVVGDGPLRGLLRDGPANVAWRPVVSPDEMHGCYHAAECLLLPSQGEGLPLVVQEAMACGVPTVVSEDEPYAGPLAALGVCLTAPRTPEAMAARVSAALAGDARSLGPRARQYAASHWSADAMVRHYVGLLRELALASSGTR